MIRWFSFCLLLLVGCGPAKPPYVGKSIDELEAMLKSTDPLQQVQGAIGLGQQGSAAVKAVPSLIEVLKSPESNVRQNAAMALGRIGPAAKEAIAPLTQLLQDGEWTVRRQAVIAVGEIGDPQSLNVVKKMTKDKDALVQKAAQEAQKKLQGR